MITILIILSCVGHHHRHSAVKDIIHRTLVAAHVPSHPESPGLYRSDVSDLMVHQLELWSTFGVGCHVS